MTNNEYDRNRSNCYLHHLKHLITPITKYRKITQNISIFFYRFIFQFESSGRTFKIVLVEVISKSCYIIRKMNYGLGKLFGKNF